MDEHVPTATTETEAPGPASITAAFRSVSDEDRCLDEQLVGRRVEIFWDGDNRFYRGRVIAYDELNLCHRVQYDDSDEAPYEEDLRGSSGWRIFEGSEGQYSEFLMRLKASKPREKRVYKKSYADMLLEAVTALADKCGSSLVGLRRHVLEHNPDTQLKQPASFNTLTLKALNSLVAEDKLERDKHTYKLSASYMKAQARKASGSASMALYAANRNGGGGDGEFSGTAAEHNKQLRQLIVDRKHVRDGHLLMHMDLLAPFLPAEHNYFTARARAGAGAGAGEATPAPSLVVKGSLASPDDDADDLDDKTSTLLALRGVPMLTPAPTLVAELHEHQTQGISWMLHMHALGMPMILGDQMGLGKTLQTIGLIAGLRHYSGQRGPHLVVVPLSVLSNWISEFERFCPSLRPIRFHGPRSERERIKQDELSDPQNFDVVVTTFEMLVAECNFFRRRYVWTLVVVDEGHRLKNEKSLLSDKLRLVPALSRVILTGTPLQNNLRELWALLHFLAPDVFSRATAAAFEEGFDLARSKIDNAVLRRARKMLTLFMLRRIKDQVKIKLPSRREVTVLVPLTEQQVFWYKHMICGVDDDLVDIVMGAGNEGVTRVSGGEGDYKKLMNLLLQLRKICNHTALMPDMLEAPAEQDVVEGSGKLKMLDRMLPLLFADGHRVLIFSQFTSMLDLLEEYCDSRGWVFLRLDGSTNRVQRRLDVRRFNAPRSPVFVFLISTRAGGLGLNLASADTVILYDSDWNPQVDLQAMERAHRIGQTRPVRVFRLICRGSVEERMLSRAEKKLFLNAMVAEAGEDGDEEPQALDEADEQALGVGGGSMTKGELASLIRFGANAICDKGSGEVSDADLELLLERRGRDCTTEEVSEAVFDTEMSGSEVAKRLEMKEIDLRQLGDTTYQKPVLRKKSSQDQLDDDTLMLADDVKRVRKQRIVMVDGAGTGYGGAVPVLSEYLAPDEPLAKLVQAKSLRSRQWSHQSFCCLCGTMRRPEELVGCAHCPKVLHPDCMARVGLARTGATFQCPHHRCVACGRSTVASGGLLFRCLGCLTSYCEDCLPQDEIESVGRCRALEEIGYMSSHQAYYIKCPSCCSHEGLKPTGVDGSRETVPPDESRMDAIEGDIEGGQEVAAEEPLLWDTQTMRVFSEYTPDSEDEREGRRKKKQEERQQLKAAEAAKKTARKVSARDDEDEAGEAAPRKKSKAAAVEKPCPVDVPAACSLEEACDLLSLHPAGAAALSTSSELPSRTNPSLIMVRSKIINGKYRNIAAFVSDVRAVLKPASKGLDHYQLRLDLLEFFEEHLAPIVHL